MERITLDPMGPHSPDYTRQVARAVSEGVRVLNYATGGPAGLEYPADVYGVLGALQAAVYGLLQTLDQLTRFVTDAAAAGRAVEHRTGPCGGDTAAAVAVFREHMKDARGYAGPLADHLATAQNAISWLEAADAPGSRPT